MEDLPDEILEMILQRLSLKQKGKAQRISKRFQNILSGLLPSTETIDQFKRDAWSLGLLVLFGLDYSSNVTDNQRIEIYANDKSNETIIDVYSTNEYEIQGSYEDEIYQSILYTDTIGLDEFIVLLKTLIELYPNGTIKVNNKEYTIPELMTAIQIIVKESVENNLDTLIDLLEDKFIYGILRNDLTFDHYNRLVKRIQDLIEPNEDIDEWLIFLE
jgi:hypothetical protein